MRWENIFWNETLAKNGIAWQNEAYDGREQTTVPRPCRPRGYEKKGKEQTHESTEQAQAFRGAAQVKNKNIK